MKIKRLADLQYLCGTNNSTAPTPPTVTVVVKISVHTENYKAVPHHTIKYLIIGEIKLPNMWF